jgi:hypothetical protein
VGEATVTSFGIAPAGLAPEKEIGTNAASQTHETPVGSPLRSDLDAGRRRFTWASLIAIGVTTAPFLWILWSDWGPLNPLRKSVFEDNFYDLQARAMFHGHLSLAKGAIGIEGFVHDGRTYTYFGLFPSIVRMPLLLLTSSLDGKLTPTFMLLAWLLTGLFCTLLLWRVRFLVRGDVAMGRAEAAGFGVLLATLMGGTIWMLLASIPFVFNEDIAWSICLTVGSIFALLGVIERPSWGRVVASGVLILCANLDRSTTGWACAVAAGLVAVWFLVGFGGLANRRWFLPVLLAGLVPVVVGCAVNYGKFGVLFGVSNYEQVWTHVNAYRRKFLAANHNAEEGLIFIPTNLVTYLRPDGLGFSNVFPYISLPARPPSALGGVLFDRLYRTASLPASTPLLFLMSLWGLVTAFRPKAVGDVAKTRLLLLAAGSAGAALMLWGYIAPRYLGDFVPFLVLASAVAAADIFRRLDQRRSPSIKLGALVILSLAALFCIVANIGMAVAPNEEWNTAQALNYVNAQHALSDLTGHPLQSHVARGDRLPAWGPAGQLYVIGNCTGLYVSNGENYSTVPRQQYLRTTWMTVQLGPAALHNFDLHVGRLRSAQTVRLVGVGPDVVEVTARPISGNRLLLTFDIAVGSTTRNGSSVEVAAGSSLGVAVVTDHAKHELMASIDGSGKAFLALANSGAVRVYPNDSGAGAVGGSLWASVAPTPRPSLCQSLLR